MTTQTKAADPANAAYEAWWSTETKRGDPMRRSNIVKHAYLCAYAQARADLIAELREQARYWQDPDAPLANPSAVRRVGWLPLAIIPKE